MHSDPSPESPKPNPMHSEIKWAKEIPGMVSSYWLLDTSAAILY